jgi:predicted membrane protein
MKIKVINENGDPIRMFHDPQDVRIRSNQKIVELRDVTNGTSETFPLIKKSVGWIDVPGPDELQVNVELQVKDTSEKSSTT